MATSDKSVFSEDDRKTIIDSLKVRRAQLQRAANGEGDPAVKALREKAVLEIDTLASKVRGQSSFVL